MIPKSGSFFSSLKLRSIANPMLKTDLSSCLILVSPTLREFLLSSIKGPRLHLVSKDGLIYCVANNQRQIVAC